MPTLTLREGLGRPLTYKEMDDNLRFVETKAQEADGSAASAGLAAQYAEADRQHVDQQRQAVDAAAAAVDQAIANAGYVGTGPNGEVEDYAEGIEITARNQVIRADGELWRISASVDLPYTTTGAGMPEGGAFVSVGDASLRQELADPDKGAAMVARGVVAVDSIADLLALPPGQRREGLRYLVKGYHAGTGVGGGEFYWDAASTDTEDGGVVFGSGTGRFLRVVNGRLTPQDFGAKCDGTLDGDTQAVAKAVESAIALSVDLDFGSYEYDLGTVAGGEWKVSVDSPNKVKFTGSGALIRCRGIGPGRSSTFGVRNPVNWESIGIDFTDPDFDIASTVGGGALRVGTYGYLIYATAPYSEELPCGNIEIQGNANNCMGLVVCDSTSQLGVTGGVPYAVRNLRVFGECDTVYYGVSSIYGATDITTKLICKDVRRGFISYGQRGANIDLSLDCSAGFIGSNAFVSLACEGSEGNVSGIDIRLLVSGVEAHAGYVHFYHQQGDIHADGYIKGVTSVVTVGDLTPEGKHPSLGPAHVYRFSSVTVAGTPLLNTNRRLIDADLECLGSTSGRVFLIESTPNVKDSIKLGDILTSNLNNYAPWLAFKVVEGVHTRVWTPVLYGATTQGSASYSVQKGVYTADAQRFVAEVQLTWTGHTGTGFLRLDSLPLPTDITAYTPHCEVVSFGGSWAGGGNILAAVAGDNRTLYFYRVGLESGAIANLEVPPSGSIILSISGNLSV